MGYCLINEGRRFRNALRESWVENGKEFRFRLAPGRGIGVRTYFYRRKGFVPSMQCTSFELMTLNLLKLREIYHGSTSHPIDSS